MSLINRLQTEKQKIMYLNAAKESMSKLSPEQRDNYRLNLVLTLKRLPPKMVADFQMIKDQFPEILEEVN